jgi:hypothetical protein
MVGNCIFGELRLSLQKLSQIKVHEVREYNATQFDPTSGEGGRLLQYINTLKLKTEFSGFTIGQ